MKLLATLALIGNTFAADELVTGAIDCTADANSAIAYTDKECKTEKDDQVAA